MPGQAPAQQVPQGARLPPQMTPQQQQFIQEQQASLFSGLNVAGEVPLPGWFQTYDGFDVNSYSFDVEQMANLFQTHDPNGTFDGTRLQPLVNPPLRLRLSYSEISIIPVQ